LDEKHERELDYLLRERGITREEYTPEVHRILGGIKLTGANTVKPARTDWLWPGYIPFGKITVLDGNPGQGKSTLTLALAAAVSNGEALPGLSHTRRDPMDVILLSAEDGLDDTILPRLSAHGADTGRVHALEAVVQPGEPDRPWSLPADIEALRYAIGATGARLVIIDPLMAFLGGSVDSHRDQDVRLALHPLSQLASSTGASILIVRHLNKSGQGLAMLRGGGSVGIIGAARAGMVVGVDPHDPTGEQKVLAVSKMNLGKPGESQAFHLETDSEYGCGRVVWDGPSMHTAETVLAQVDSEDAAEIGRASDLLKSLLSKGPIPIPEVLKAARSAGIQDRHLAKARRMLRVDDLHVGALVYWSIPVVE